ncbi:MAG TPA: hypothetical protein VG326_08825 [Tepidisphaeraceae bacterium]|nr:hypothetical protein [Tepidisphaeraceae bacterium]
MLVALLAAPMAWGQLKDKAPVLRERDAVTVDDKGDSTYTGKLVFPSEAIYSQVKENFPNPYMLLKNILGARAKTQNTNATASYDDAHRSIQLSATVLGAAVNKHNKWRMEVGKSTELLHVDGRTAILINATSNGGPTMVISGEVTLPEGAKDIKVDSDTGTLIYEFDRPVKTGPVTLDADLKVKPRLMSALYKVYGNSDFDQGIFWSAKTVFTNSGQGDVNHLKVSYRIGDYSPWSPPTEYSLVPPGGHVVDLYFPLLNKDTADLKSQTPVDLEVRYTYTDATGKEYSDSTAKRITMLGSNGIEYSNSTDEDRSNNWSDLFSNSPLVAAFVTKMDDPVRAFSGMVSQLCGGQPAGLSDDAAVKFCKSLYDLELANHVSYQWSVGLLTANGGVSQELKYPRDVLRDRSGTCIELAIFYASVCESAGLHCDLVMIPGHCFPVVRLPSGGLLPVEATAISGPAINEKHPDPFTFEEAVKFAVKEYNGLKMGLFFQIDVDHNQAEGVLCPELTKLPADIVNTWGYKLPTSNADQKNDNHADANANNNGPNNPPAVNNHPAVVVGVWDGRFRLANGTQVSVILQLAPTGRYTTHGVARGLAPFEFQGSWEVIEGSNIVFRNETTHTTETDHVTVDGNTMVLSLDNVGKIVYARRN